MPIALPHSYLLVRIHTNIHTSGQTPHWTPQSREESVPVLR